VTILLVQIKCRVESARICDKELRYHYQLMDYDVSWKLLVNKDKLEKNDEGKCLTFVCEQVYGGDWDAYYAACNLHLITFGANAGMYEVLDDLETNTYATYLENLVTTLSTLGITCAPKTSLKRKTNSITIALRIMRKYAHLHDAFTFTECVWGSFSKI
jgi:hypothetical protein